MEIIIFFPNDCSERTSLQEEYVTILVTKA
jgi:hypothetical protein